MREEIRNRAIALIKSGKKNEARQLLGDHVQRYPNDAQGWALLFYCLDKPEQKRFCLEKVLSIDPGNEKARQTLARLTGESQAAQEEIAAQIEPAEQEEKPAGEEAVVGEDTVTGEEDLVETTPTGESVPAGEEPPTDSHEESLSREAGAALAVGAAQMADEGMPEATGAGESAADSAADQDEPSAAEPTEIPDAIPAEEAPELEPIAPFETGPAEAPPFAEPQQEDESAIETGAAIAAGAAFAAGAASSADGAMAVEEEGLPEFSAAQELAAEAQAAPTESPEAEDIDSLEGAEALAAAAAGAPPVSPAESASEAPKKRGCSGCILWGLVALTGVLIIAVGYIYWRFWLQPAADIPASGEQQPLLTFTQTNPPGPSATLLPSFTPIPTDTRLPTLTPIPSRTLGPTETEVITPTLEVTLTPTLAPTTALTNPPPGDIMVQIRGIFFAGIAPGEGDEYVEIANMGTGPVDLAGWILRAVDAGQEFTFPSFVMVPGAVCRVYTNLNDPAACGFSFNSPAPIWNDLGDCAVLRDTQNIVIDDYCY